MFFPILDVRKNQKAEVTAFGGLNLSENSYMGEFSEMQNTTSDKFPFISPSARKDTVQINAEIKNIKALTSPGEVDMMTGFTGVADGNFYYQDEKIPLKYSFMNIPEDSEVELVHFCDRIIIMPQMYYYNYLQTGIPYVYPLIQGVYSDWVRVESADILGQPAVLTLQDSINTWHKYGFKAGDSIVMQTTLAKYRSLNTYIAKNKYEELPAGRIVKAEVLSVTDTRMTVNLYDKYNNIIIFRDTDGKLVDNVFKDEELVIYKRYSEFNHGCVYANRIWATTKQGDAIYASSPGNPGIFTQFEGTSTDSWYTEVGEGGDFTGLTTFNNSVLAFKKNCIYQIFGNRPSNFSIGKQFFNCGCVDSKSVCKTDSSVYFLGADGVYEYSGSSPVKISEKLNLKNCVSGAGFSDGRKYYLSCNGEEKLYSYDRSNGFWHVEGMFNIINGIVFKGNIFFALKNEILKLTDEYNNEWMAVSCDITENDMTQKGINNLFLRIKNGINSWIEVSCSVNNGEFFCCGKFEEEGEYTLRVPVRFKKGDKYKIKLSGKGSTLVKGIERYVYLGGKSFTRKG